ncbi:PRC-barrel domain containing protein [Rhodobacterales bacterium HKCCE3408]|nr:PRC-barrel domain containing protein [Rhodobacterales bacterium HKCCE3408]
MLYRTTALAIVAVSLQGLPVAAQEVIEGGMIQLDDWNYDELRDADTWSVDTLFGNDVMGSADTRIGDVEDLVLNDEGEVIALIAEVGGFWDIGDTHVSVPWDQVVVATDGEVAVPVNEDNVDEFDLFDSSGLSEDTKLSDNVVGGLDSEELGTGLWRASDLLGDYVRVMGEEDAWVNFGYVSDLMVNADGQIAATLVTATTRYGPGTYAYPYYAPSGREGFPAWSPGARSYDLPILVDEAMSIPTVDQDHS